MFGDHWCQTSQHSHFMLVYECWPRCTFRWLRMKAADSNFIKFLWAFPDRWSKSPLHVTVLSYAMQTTIPRKKTTRHKSALQFLCFSSCMQGSLRLCEMCLLTYLQQAACQRPRLNRNKQSLCAQHTHTPHAQPMPWDHNRIYQRDFPPNQLSTNFTVHLNHTVTCERKFRFCGFTSEKSWTDPNRPVCT